MSLTKEQIEELNRMSEMTCEQCNNYSGIRSLFSSVCTITEEEIPDSGMVCNCGKFEEFKDDDEL